MKKSAALPMKGLRTPRLLIWMLGFFHGKIIRTGGLDPASNTLSSGYVTRQIKCFGEACTACRKEAEKKLVNVWPKAQEKLMEYAAVSAALAASGGYVGGNGSAQDKRAADQAADAYAARLEKRQAILKELCALSNQIHSEQNQARARMEATAERLLSVFATYGHGLLMKPVYLHHLPQLQFEDCAQQILKHHEAVWNTIETILKEALK